MTADKYRLRKTMNILLPMISRDLELWQERLHYCRMNHANDSSDIMSDYDHVIRDGIKPLKDHGPGEVAKELAQHIVDDFVPVGSRFNANREIQTFVNECLAMEEGSLRGNWGC